MTVASIAGSGLAWWLATLVERAAEFRGDGQNVDIRGIGREVIPRVWLKRQVLALGIREVGSVFFDERGRPVTV